MVPAQEAHDHSFSDPSWLAGSGAPTRHLARVSVADGALFEELGLDLSMAERAMAKFQRAQS